VCATTHLRVSPAPDLWPCTFVQSIGPDLRLPISVFRIVLIFASRSVPIAKGLSTRSGNAESRQGSAGRPVLSSTSHELGCIARALPVRSGETIAVGRIQSRRGSWAHRTWPRDNSIFALYSLSDSWYSARVAADSLFPSGDWKWALMAVVSLYGAGLSTYNAYVARTINKRQLKITLKHGFLTFGPEPSDDMLILGASNPGHRPVTLTSVGLLLPDKRQMIFPHQDGSARLPHQLNEGTSVTHWMPAREVAEELRRRGFVGHIRLLAFYSDATDEQHQSHPLRLDL
jgi:hypothetical protein